MKKWLLRFLMCVVVIIAMSLLGLNIISGTSETQKGGLEKAFSQVFSGQASIGKLQAFNLFPQFIIAMDKLMVTGVKGVGVVSADEAKIAFGLGDLILKNRKIEIFHLKNLHIDDGLYLPLTLDIKDAGIYAGATPETGKFTFTGTYGGEEMTGEIAMQAEPHLQPKYAFHETNPLTMVIGAVKITGQFEPYHAGSSQISKLVLTAAQKKGAKECVVPENVTLSTGAFFHDVLEQLVKVKTPQDFDTVCQTLKTEQAL